ncbi:uncharacterized protein LOC130787990 isoform X1 [Actinidia eriantha]|uniref:uncharacterized protein LOC130787990 isoform X1 n=1 Tax=Actinidia eriantha TaxID=165200 RepID=UPI002590B535|nr:uncharacterized protein LOC130787990 isoform X1 [Actinidia eriantha]XP_057504486.1 uncharacterized protein LOC130787990 isoform X1 [Actinidia eriantha]
MKRDTFDDDGKEAAESSWSPEIQNNWIETQDFLKTSLVTEDDFTWHLPTTTAIGGGGGGVLKYVGGVDVSFSKDDPSIACGTLVVLDFHTLNVVYHDYSLVSLHIPYVTGFLAFREAPILLELLEKMKNCAHPFYPQLLMVDGNGLLHPRGFGLACHLGVQANLPTIGIGKNLHHVDGLTQYRVRQLLEAKGNFPEDYITLTGDSGCVWGAAMRSTVDTFKPIFISVGHRVSLPTAVKIAKMTCKFRVPEPIRQADIRSRDYLRKHQWVQ